MHKTRESIDKQQAAMMGKEENAQEELIAKFKLSMLYNSLSLIDVIVTLGYRKTGNKFSVNFNGSKGYLSNVEIICEGVQKERNNVIWIEQLKTKNNTLRSKMVSIFHSEENGIRIDISVK